jgi:hypothetical protein
MSWWGSLAGPPNFFEGHLCANPHCFLSGVLQDWTQFVRASSSAATNAGYQHTAECAGCRRLPNISTEYRRVMQLPQAATLYPPRAPGTVLSLVLQAGAQPLGVPFRLAFQVGAPPVPPAGPPGQGRTVPANSANAPSLPPGDRKNTDPNWPIDYPGVAKCNSTPPASIINESSHNYLSLKKGDEFQIVSKPVNNMVKIRYTEEGEEGWVPWQDVDAGETISLVEEPLKYHNLNPPQPTHIEINVNNDDADVLAVTIFQLVEKVCEYFKDNKNAYCSTYDTPEKRLIAAQKMYNGAKRIEVLPDFVDDDIKTLVDILTNPDFCVSDFAKLRPVKITDIVDLIVNYLIVYSDFPDGRAPEIYDGKSIQAGERLEEHESLKTSDRFEHSVHYQSAREAGEWQMYHLCDLDYNDIDLVPFTEQMTVLLFETYHPNVLKFANSAHPKADEFTTDRKFATDLLRIAQDVFRVTGWPGGCISNTNFGASVGLNWKSPVVQHDVKRLLWTKTHSRGKGYEFRRTTKDLPSDLTLLRLVNLASLRTPLHLIPVGTDVHVIFEFTEDQSPHEYAFASFSPFFGTTDALKALSWALRVEWQDGDDYKVAYLTRSARRETRISGYQDVCALVEYAMASTIFSYFHQEVPDHSALPFLRTAWSGIADIVNQTYDFKNHTLKFERLFDMKKLSQDESPRLLTTQEKHDRLAEVFKDIPYELDGTGPCDGCRYLNSDSHVPAEDRMPCERYERHPECQFCAERNMTCTWSPRSDQNPYNVNRKVYIGTAVEGASVEIMGLDEVFGEEVADDV